MVVYRLNRAQHQAHQQLRILTRFINNPTGDGAIGRPQTPAEIRERRVFFRDSGSGAVVGSRRNALCIRYHGLKGVLSLTCQQQVYVARSPMLHLLLQLATWFWYGFYGGVARIFESPVCFPERWAQNPCHSAE